MSERGENFHFYNGEMKDHETYYIVMDGDEDFPVALFSNLKLVKHALELNNRLYVVKVIPDTTGSVTFIDYEALFPEAVRVA